MAVASVRKAIAPFAVALAAAVSEWIVTGDLDVGEVRTVFAGAVTALVVYFVRND